MNEKLRNEIVQRLLLLNDVEDRAQFADVVKLRLIEQILRARRCQRRLFFRTRAAHRRGNIEPSIVNSDAHESKPRLLQQIAREDIPGVLDPNLGAGLEQGLNDQAKGSLESGGDQNLIGGACDIPRDPQIARNCDP